MSQKPFVHRFIPNSAPGVRETMLQEAGFNHVDEIYEEIPEKLRYKGKLNLPDEPVSEHEVSRQIRSLLWKNQTSEQLLSFLGAGCWPHYVPALCTEITGRSEFQTAYAGGEAADHGRYQAMFEYQSMMGDLLAMDIVSAPVYDGNTACGDALQMASRATGRKEMLYPATINPHNLSTLVNYCDPWLTLKAVRYDPQTGLMDLEDLASKISTNTAAVLVENPTYLGVIEAQCSDITRIAHAHGALLVAYVNPLSLGVLAAPGEYGADLACGEGQPLGLGLNFGGATLGILACNDTNLFQLMPSYLVSITKTVQPGEFAFSWHTLWERIVYSSRYKAKSYTGTSAWLWGICAAVYLSLMGPNGMRQVGETNILNAQYAMDLLGRICNVNVPVFSSTHFNEFVVSYNRTGKTVREINSALRERGILGGKDLSAEFPQLGQSALYCVTEIHTKKDIGRLARALAEIV